MQTFWLIRIPAKLLGCFLFFALTHWTQPVSAAMEIICVEPSENKNGQCLSIFLRGMIEKGDYERFLSFYRPLHRTVRKLYLQSPGGDPEEAMKFGRLMRKYLVAVEAPIGGGGEDGATQMLFSPTLELCEGSACVCASACALIWFSSVERWGSVGLHRPRITDPQFATLPLGEARTTYNKALQRIIRYLEEMEVPRPLMDTMVATGTDNIHWVYDHENDFKLQHPPSFVEWVNARCRPPLDYLTSVRCRDDLVLAERKSLSAP